MKNEDNNHTEIFAIIRYDFIFSVLFYCRCTKTRYILV